MVVAGGGISGLALAAAIQRFPAETRPRVVVLERDASSAARRQGYGVTLSETNAALEGLGILDACRARDARESRSKAHWTFHATGRVLGYYGAAFLPKPARVPSEGAAPPRTTTPTRAVARARARRRTCACRGTTSARCSSRSSPPTSSDSAREPSATKRTTEASTSTWR